MGFSTSVHGEAAHEALLIRQESELRLLETMRKCLQMKVKCDREYAASLLAAVMHGQKVELGDGANDSAVLQAWKSMLEGFEFVSKLVRNSSDLIEGKVLDRLNTLYFEKRKAKKFYAEEHARITQQFHKLTDDVTRKKLEYQKNLELYRSARARFDDYFVKGNKTGKKIEDLREKYQKGCKKLRQTHNEYVLLLAEAAEFERDYRTVLFPGLLESHQSVQEALAEEWKSVLEDVANCSSLCTDQFQDLETRVKKIVEGIRPSMEYVDYTEKFRSAQNHPSIFNFDESLLDDSDQLQPNQLTVDSLTVDWLRTRLSELDSRVKNEQNRMLHLGESILQNGKLHEGNNRINASPELARRRRELMEIRCDERKLTRQVEMIKSALSGPEVVELPPGCESVRETNEPEECLTRPPSTLSLQKRSLTSILSRVRKKSTPTAPRRVTVTPEPEVGDQLDEVQVICYSRVRANTNKLYEWGLVSNRALVEEEWFHGVLPREEVVRLLNKEGDFLLRETTRNEENQTVLSVAWGGHKHFIVQMTPEGLYRFEGPAFPTIQELIVHQYQSGLPVTARSGAILKRPILRERWELNNDDVILIDKIGRGNFGDVYKARLKRTRQDVAVKTCRMTLPEEQKKKFLQEGRILKQYDHPNIVKLVGICVQKQPIMIVMELVSGGSLLTFLRNNAPNLTQRRLLRMCKDVAAGMRYLESRNCIHRDLAARNCLIGDDEMVKISDFGMSREEEEYIVSDGMKQIPIKWTAPEALNFGKYTSLCDVWSYGVLSWEVFARGEVPYPGMSNSKARERIDAGYRMAPPEGTPDDMYKLMLLCWEYEAENRPHFDEIFDRVTHIETNLYPDQNS